MHEDDVALTATRVEVVGGEAVSTNETPVDFEEHGGPDLADGVHLVLGGDGSVGVGVGVHVAGVGNATNTGLVVVDVGAEGEVGDGSRLLLGEEGHGVGPSLAHATSFGRAEAGASSSASHAVADAVGELVRDNVVLEGTVPLRGAEGPGVHAALSSLAIRGSSEVGVVGAGDVLNGELDGVTLLSTFAKVLLLEVEGSLGEAITVSDILVWI